MQLVLNPLLVAPCKPVFKIRKFFEKEGSALDSLMMIGDQILTDVFCANKFRC